MTNWISVKKCLPPFYQSFLYVSQTVKDCPEFEVGYLTDDENSYFDYNATKNFIEAARSGLITHWIPLPELPHD